MKVLLDHNMPVGLAKLLIGCEVFTARELLWDKLDNGALLNAAQESGFSLMVTADQGIYYQQNNRSRTIGLVVVSTNDWRSLAEQVDALNAALVRAKLSGFEVIHIPLKPKSSPR